MMANSDSKIAMQYNNEVTILRKLRVRFFENIVKILEKNIQDNLTFHGVCTEYLKQFQIATVYKNLKDSGGRLMHLFFQLSSFVSQT